MDEMETFILLRNFVIKSRQNLLTLKWQKTMWIFNFQQTTQDLVTCCRTLKTLIISSKLLVPTSIKMLMTLTITLKILLVCYCLLIPTLSREERQSSLAMKMVITSCQQQVLSLILILVKEKVVLTFVVIYLKNKSSWMLNRKLNSHCGTKGNKGSSSLLIKGEKEVPT